MHAVPEKSICLVALDIDGTLSDTQYRIPPANRQAIQDLRDAGIIVVLATGRRFASAVRFARAVGVTAAGIFQNGAVIKDIRSRQLVFWQGLSPSLVRHVLKMGRMEGFSPLVFFGPDGPGRILLEERRLTHCPLEAYLMRSWDDVVVIPCLAETDLSNVVQVMFCGPVAAMRRLAERLRNRLERDANIFLTEYPQRDLTLLDVMHWSVSKGDALRRVAGIYGLPLRQTAAIGDNFNDLEMLQAAGLALVMGNADERLRARFRNVLPDCAAGGVAWGIWRYILPREDRLTEWFPAQNPTGKEEHG
ncbi:MAG: HAD-IIB family hydrolase [Acidobacteria bacterium]|nr:HAD-IIB family hydrolase [Acidobacteriota bacterium]